MKIERNGTPSHRSMKHTRFPSSIDDVNGTETVDDHTKKRSQGGEERQGKARQGTHTHIYIRRINQLTTNKSTTITCVVMENSTRGRGREHFPERNSPVASSKIIILAFFTNARARETNDR